MPLKTATELGLSEKQRCGLIKTLAALESGKLYEEFNIRFDMQHWGAQCGTACCIGGSAEALMKDDGLFGRFQMELEAMGQNPSELAKLFYPQGMTWGTGPWMATPKQAAKALRHYLTTGKEDWAGAMRG